MTAPFTILVVEDEPMIRWDVAEHLEDEGYTVLQAGDADEALALMEKRQDVRLIFTDVDMPGSMDGLKLAQAVRDRWPPIRIVVTSGKRMVEITDLPDGSVFFAKPYNHTAVAASMQELLAV